jgi:hypothetical protein
MTFQLPSPSETNQHFTANQWADFTMYEAVISDKK